MSEEKKVVTLGQAIDSIVEALAGLDEANRAVAVRAASEAMGLQVPSTAGAQQSGSGGSSAAGGGTPPLGRLADIKSLKEQKQPRTAIEMACIMAFYLQELAPSGERRAQITSADIDTYFRQAGHPLPKAKSQLLVDAKDAGYFDAAGSGAYKLNAVGYNLVAHTLPRSGGESAPATRKPRRRSSGQKKPKSKPK